ncbi:hypothetical protein ACFSJQ_22670 [Vibrio olivae]|uniref:Uncharacterized protein n=1 Tax=Vibrio olivae TaxID=1243002 RepID=A0ABV5HPS2_9VIBR
MDIQRIRFVVIFSVDERCKVELVTHKLGHSLSGFFGGVTFFDSNVGCTGYWSSDGHDYKTKYIGDVAVEPVVMFSLLVTKNNEEFALTTIKALVKDVCVQFDTDTNHVHVESQIVNANHFSLN